MITTQSARPRMAPGPKGHPVWGSTLDLQRNPLQFLTSALHEYGDIVRVRFVGNVACHLFNHPDAVEHVLRANFHNYPKGNFTLKITRLVTGEGLAASDDDDWLQKRRVLQPAFHRPRLAGLAAVMSSAAEAMAADWTALANTGEAHDIAAEMMRVTLRIVGEALFSIDISQAEDQIGQAMTMVVSYSGYRLTHPLALPEAIPTARNLGYRKAVQTLDRVVLDIIRERQHAGTAQADLLTMLMHTRDEETGAGMTPEQLRAEVKTLMISGHETTAVALAWTWYLLSQHPQVEEKLHAELDAVLNGRTPTFADLPHLPYTKMVLEESIRLRPPAWITVRTARNDDEYNGYHIPAGSLIGLSPYVVQRHPDFWENPETFDPERFSPQRAAGRHKYAYMAFSGGPRLCIGSAFAMMEAQLVLATLAQQYRLTLAASHQVVPELGATMRPRGGLPMLLHTRKAV